jgi:hypothetical protein
VTPTDALAGIDEVAATLDGDGGVRLRACVTSLREFVERRAQTELPVRLYRIHYAVKPYGGKLLLAQADDGEHVTGWVRLSPQRTAPGLRRFKKSELVKIHR